MKEDLGYRCPYSPFLEQSTAAINEESLIHSQPNLVSQEKQCHMWGGFQKGKSPQLCSGKTRKHMNFLISELPAGNE